jgi:hypothetical protein
MAREAPRERNPIVDRTCKLCKKIYRFPAGATQCMMDRRIERAPEFALEDRLKLRPSVFAERFPRLDETSNLFAVAGPLYEKRWDPETKCLEKTLTMNCLIQSDDHRHFYVVRVRLLGEAPLAENRLIHVRAGDLEKVPAAPNLEPNPEPRTAGQ